MIKVNHVGEIVVTKEVLLSNDQKKELIRLIIVRGYEKFGEYIHDRWSALYNAYDLYCGGYVRADHLEYPVKSSRIDYLVNIGRIDMLLYIASRLYVKEFEAQVNIMLEGM